MCKHMNGFRCECEFTNSDICKNPSDCEYIEENINN